MKTPGPRLYGPKQIVLMTAASSAGVCFFLYRRYYETGKLGRVELIATLFTTALVITICVVMVRIGNRSD